jgi:D-alanyl-D-alanine carboxypeptidase
MTSEWGDYAAVLAKVGGLLRESGVPGATVVVCVDGRMVINAGVGHADLAGIVPLDANAPMYLYSVTKVLLAAAVMRLVEEGRLGLDAAAHDLLPDVALPAPVTLRQLLNHTSGLPDYGGLPGYFDDLRADPRTPWTDDAFLERTLAQGMRFTPGEGWAYSNIGYQLVRRVVEDVAGDGFLDRALGGLLFQPLGLTRMSVPADLDAVTGLTPGFSAELDRDGSLHDISTRYHPGWVSHGVVMSTAADIARIVEALFAGELVSRAALDEMLTGVSVGGSHSLSAEPGYGLGLRRDLAPGSGLVAGHAGGGPGYSAAAFRFESASGRRVTCVALANSDRGDIATRITFTLARRWLDTAP